MAVSSPCGTLQNFFLRFLIFKPQNLLPKIWHKIAYKSTCIADRQKMFGPTRGFSGIPDSIEPCKMLWGQPLLPWQQNFGKFGLFFHKNAYKSACMPDRLDMFRTTRGDDQGGGDLCCHGAESNRLPACSVFFIAGCTNSYKYTVSKKTVPTNFLLPFCQI